MSEDKFDVALRLYDEWRERRNLLVMLEYKTGKADEGDWQESDDQAVEMVDDLANLLTEVLGR